MTRLTLMGALMIGLTACVVRSGPPPDGRPAGPGPGGPPASGPAYVPPNIGPATFIVPDLSTNYTYEDAYLKLRSLGVTGDIIFSAIAEESAQIRVFGIDGPGRTESTRVPILIAVKGGSAAAVFPMVGVVGMKITDAITKMTASKMFAFTVRHVPASANCAKDVVCSTVPNLGESTRLGDSNKMLVVGIE